MADYIVAYGQTLSNQTFGGGDTIYVQEGGTLSDCVITRDVEDVTLEDYAILSGTIETAREIFVCGYVNADSADLIFDISERSPEEDCFLNSFFGMKSIAITVSADQEQGVYRLFDDAWDFGGMITLRSTSGAEIGKIGAGENLSVGDVNHKLIQNGSELALAVFGPDSAPPTVVSVAADTTEPTNMVVVTATFEDDTAVLSRLYRIGEAEDWFEYGNGVKVFVNATVYFKAVDVMGNESEIASYEVTNIDRTIPFQGVELKPHDSRKATSGQTYLDTVINGGRLTLSSGAVASNTVANSGELNIFSGGSADDTIIRSGASAIVGMSGTANGVTIESGGRLVLSSGGTATDVAWTPFEGALEFSQYYGSIEAQVALVGENSGVYVGSRNRLVSHAMELSSMALYVGSTASMYVMGGGTGTAISLEKNGLVGVFSGGVVNSVYANGGSMYVFSGGLLNSVIAYHNSGIYIASGGTLTGRIVADERAVSFGSGAVLNFDLTNVQPGMGAIVTNFSSIQGFPAYNITVKAEGQEEGVYKLADKLGSSFNETITIVNSVGDELGSISVGQQKKFGGVTYALSSSYQDGNRSLTLKIGEKKETPSPYTSVGLVLMNTGKSISSGGVFHDTILLGGSLTISRGGTATVLSAINGYLNILSGGVASDVVFNGGSLYLRGERMDYAVLSDAELFNTRLQFSGAFVMNNVVLNNVSANLMNNNYRDWWTICSASGLVVNSGAKIIVSSMCNVSDTTVNSGGSLTVSGRASAYGVTVNPGGVLRVNTYNGLVAGIVENGGYVSAASNGSAFFSPNEFSDLDIVASATVHCGTTATRITISRSRVEVFAGGIVNSALIEERGQLSVSSGGTALNLAWTPFDGDVDIAEGACVTIATPCSGVYYGSEDELLSHETLIESQTMDSYGSMFVMSGGTANDTTVAASGFIYGFGGTATRTEIGSDGRLILFNGHAEKTTVNENGRMIVSATGTAENTTVNGFGSMFVSGGGIAKNTTVNENAWMVVSGGAVENTTINPNGYVEVRNGGSAYGTIIHSGAELHLRNAVANVITVNANGLLHVSSGGKAYEVRENGGYVSVEADARAMFVSNSFSGLALSNASATVHSGTTATATTVENGFLEVFHGGLAKVTTVNGGGQIYVFSGGSADDTIVNAGGGMSVRGGMAKNVTVNSDCGMSVNSGGTAENVTVNAGANLSVYSGGTAENAAVNAGANMDVNSGGTVENAAVNAGANMDVNSGGVAHGIVENGGCVNVWNGAEVTFAANSFGGLMLSNASATVHSGTTATDITINENGEFDIFDGGIVTGTTVNANGNLYVYEGGTANETTVNVGAYLDVNSGGVAHGIVENGGFVEVWNGTDVSFAANTFGGLTLSNAFATVHSGTTATDITVDENGGFDVYSGGVATGITVNMYGRIYVYGGSVESTIVNDGAYMTVYSGGVARGIVENGGSVSVDEGAIVEFEENTISGLTLSGYATVHSATTAVDITIENGSLDLFDGGIVTGTTVNGGRFSVFSGGTAQNATVNANGRMFVYSDGVADDIVENGGYVEIQDGAHATFAANSFSGLALSGYYNSATVHSGTTAMDTTIEAGALFNVFDGGLVTGTTVNTGRLEIQSGGSADRTSVYSTSMTVSGGGKVTGTTVFANGMITVSDGALADDVIVESGGSIQVLSGGTATGIVAENGAVLSLEVTTATTVTGVRGGTAFEIVNGTVSDLTLGNGYLELGEEVAATGIAAGIGTVQVSSGARIDGVTVDYGGSIVLLGGCTAGGVVVAEGGSFSFEVASDTVIQADINGSAFEMKDASISGYTVANGFVNVLDGTAADVTVGPEGSMTVSSGGTATNATVVDGFLTVSSGGTATNVTVAEGGRLVVQSGGTATDVLWTPCFGTVSIGEGAHVTFASEYSGVYFLSGGVLSQAQIMESQGVSKTSMYVMSGGIVMETTVGQNGQVTVCSGGTAIYTNVRSSGSLVISSGGTAIGTTADHSTCRIIVTGGGHASGTLLLSGGSLVVSSGGTAVGTTAENFSCRISALGGLVSATTIVSGGLYVSSGGTAVSTTLVNSVGALIVSSGGTAVATTISSGSLYVSGGTAVDTWILGPVGNMTVSKGTVNGVTVGSGGYLRIDGGKLTGINRFDLSAQVITYGNVIIDFDLTQTAPDSEALFNRLFNVKSYTVTVNSDGQADGLYRLADGAAGFDRSITVVNTAGAELGCLTVGETATIAGTAYTLDLSGDTLTLLVVGSPPTEPSESSGRPVIAGRTERVQSGEELRDALILSGGTLQVVDDGRANGTTVDKDGLLLLSGGGIAFTALILSGGSVRVESNALASDVSIADGGALNVGFSGYALSVMLASGGNLDIASGGTAVGAMLRDSMRVHSGGAMFVTVVSSGGKVIADGASMDYTAVSFGGTVAASDCTLNNTFVSSGGRVIVNGGTLDGVTVEEGGRIEILSGATATGLDVSSGAYLGFAIASGTYITGLYGAYAPSRVHSTYYYGSAFEVKGGVVSGYVIDSGSLDILAGGSAYNVTVSSDGSLVVSSGGKLSGRLNCSGGIVSAADGAVFDFDLTKIVPWVWARIGDLSCVSGTPDYTLTVREDQAAGVYSLAEGAETFDQTITVVNAAGAQLGKLSAGETVTIAGTKYTLDLSFGTLSLKVGEEYAAPVNVYNGTIVRGLPNTFVRVSSGFVYHDTLLTTPQEFQVLSGGLANQTTVNSNGVLIVSFGGVADHTTVNEHGVPRIFGGVMNYTTINRDGSLFVYEGGTANHTEVSSGNVHIYSGGTANGITLSNGASLWVRAGGKVTDLEILSGGHLEFVVAPTPTLNESDQTVIEGSSGGSAFRINGSVVSGFGIASSYIHLMSGGTATDITLKDASRMDVNNSAVAEGVTVNSGALLNVLMRGSVTAVVENGGYVKTRNAIIVTYVPNTISGLVLSHTSASVHSATTLNSVTCIGSDSLLEIFGGGKMTGRMVFGDEATIICEGGIVNFNISGLDPDAPALIDNLSRLSGWAGYTLTVDPDLKPGTYRYVLADGAADFNGTITVLNEEDVEIGELSLVGEPLTIGYTTFTLNLTGSVLSVTAFLPEPPQPVNLAGTSENVSWEAVGEAQYIVEYSTDNFEHVIRVVTTEQSVDTLDLPAGTYQWRVKADRGEDWVVGEALVSEAGSDTPKVMRSDEDGNDDLFFASAVGTWGDFYYAQHVGSINDWSGTNDLVSASGKGRIQNLFFGSSDPNVLCLTDGENGDAIFVDDVFTDLPDEIETNMARLYRIQEIRAGAGDDIVDMTSQRFEYTGGGLVIHGGDGSDVVWANKGDNFLFGDAGDDRLVGASGNDVIAGGIGNDRMDGGGGNDVFTFCDNWGKDVVEQFASGSVTLWFASGDESNWNEASMTYTDGENSVTVKGALPEKITLKFGDDGSALFASLSGMGAFADFSSQRIFEESGSSGLLASL